MKHYTKQHQWVELENGIATIGITKFAAGELGTLSYVELPAVGKTIQGDELLGVVESVKTASDIFMPVTGIITEVNDKLETEPTLVNDAPEGDGWICKATGVDASAVDALMDEGAYLKYTAE